MEIMTTKNKYNKKEKKKDSSPKKYKFGRDESKNNIKDLPKGLRVDTTTGMGANIFTITKKKPTKKKSGTSKSKKKN